MLWSLGCLPKQRRNTYQTMLSPVAAWTVVIAGYALPILHVLLSSAAGPWKPPAGTRCPFGPRVGWLIIVLLLGVFGWLMFVLSKRQRPAL